MFKKLVLSITAALVAGSIVAFASTWGNLPIVGGASFCNAYSGAAGTTCSSTTPAGPTTLTGNERIPADTYLSGGRSPQTVTITSALLGGYTSVLYSGATIAETVANNVTNVILSHTTTITSAAITAPANPINGQRVKIGATHTVTTFSFVANTGQTLAVTTPTVLTASTTVPQGYEFVYYNTIWYRMQ